MIEIAKASLLGVIGGSIFQAHQEYLGLAGRGDCPDLGRLGRIIAGAVVGAFYGTAPCLLVIKGLNEISVCLVSDEIPCTHSEYWEIAKTTVMGLTIIATMIIVRTGGNCKAEKSQHSEREQEVELLASYQHPTDDEKAPPLSSRERGSAFIKIENRPKRKIA